MGTLALPRRNGSASGAAQGPVVSSSGAVLQGLALAHFYLLEEARAVEPALSLGAHSGRNLLEQEDRTSLALVGQRHHCRELHGHLRDGGASEEALQQLSVHCGACRGTNCDRRGDRARGFLRRRRGGRVTAI